MDPNDEFIRKRTTIVDLADGTLVRIRPINPGTITQDVFSSGLNSTSMPSASPARFAADTVACAVNNDDPSISSSVPPDSPVTSAASARS